MTFDVPASLLDREIDRRVEEFVRRLMDQQIDPMKVNINWEEFREKQRDAASEAVRGALALDEVARREHIAATEEEINARSAGLRRAQRPDRAGRARPAGEGGRAGPPVFRDAAREDRRLPPVEGHKDSDVIAR